MKIKKLASCFLATALLLSPHSHGMESSSSSSWGSFGFLQSRDSLPYVIGGAVLVGVGVGIGYWTCSARNDSLMLLKQEERKKLIEESELFVLDKIALLQERDKTEIERLTRQSSEYQQQLDILRGQFDKSVSDAQNHTALLTQRAEGAESISAEKEERIKELALKHGALEREFEECKRLLAETQKRVAVREEPKPVVIELQRVDQAGMEEAEAIRKGFEDRFVPPLTEGDRGGNWLNNIAAARGKPAMWVLPGGKKIFVTVNERDQFTHKYTK